MADRLWKMSYKKLKTVYAARKRRRSEPLPVSEEFDSVSFLILTFVLGFVLSTGYLVCSDKVVSCFLIGQVCRSCDMVMQHVIRRC